MRIGEYLHDQIQASLEYHIPEFKREFPWDMGKVTGRADGLYVDSQTGDLTVVEIKTMNERQYKKYEKGDFPNRGHLMQCMLGAMAVRAKQCHIIYINKAAYPADEPLLEWILPYNPEEALMEYERLSRLVDDATQGKIPQPWYEGDIILDPNSKKYYWPCGFCHWRDECIELGTDAIILPVEGEAA